MMERVRSTAITGLQTGINAGKPKIIPRSAPSRGIFGGGSGAGVTAADARWSSPQTDRSPGLRGPGTRSAGSPNVGLKADPEGRRRGSAFGPTGLGVQLDGWRPAKSVGP